MSASCPWVSRTVPWLEAGLPKCVSMSPKRRKQYDHKEGCGIRSAPQLPLLKAVNRLCSARAEGRCKLRTTGLPSRQRRQPIRRSTILPCPRLQQCRCRIGIDNRRRSPSRRPNLPSTHPRRCVSSRRVSSSRGTSLWAIDGPGRLRGNAGSWCDGTRSRGNNEDHSCLARHQQQANGSARHPTNEEIQSQYRSTLQV